MRIAWVKHFVLTVFNCISKYTETWASAAGATQGGAVVLLDFHTWYW